MMSKNGVLVFVVTFMSFIDYSYLSDIVAYPNTTDKNFGEYLMNIDWKGKGKMLRADEFLMVKEHYEFVMKKEYEKPEYAGLIEEISKFPLHNEKRLLRRYMEFDECNITIKKRIEEYIETRKQHYRNKIIKREEEAARKKAEAEEEAERASTEAEEEAERATTKAEGADLLTALGGKKDLEEIETMHGDNQLITLEQQLEEEVQFLESLYELSSNQGRIKNVYLTSVYGSNQHIIHGQMNSIDSVWLHLLRKLDPIFGEKYDSYAFRVISMKKMPLPKEQIPVYYGEGKFYLFDEFDIWPELNSAYIMYYLFNCHLEGNPKYDSSHGVTGPQPTPS